MELTQYQIVGTDECAAAHVGCVRGHRAFLLQNVLIKTQWHNRTFAKFRKWHFNMAIGKLVKIWKKNV
jgi:hypothetical protein